MFAEVVFLIENLVQKESSLEDFVHFIILIQTYICTFI